MTDWGFAMDWAATNPEHPHIRNEMYQVGMQEH
jgi:hypothetical protein